MKKFPIGISNFKEVIKEDYYYIDKSLFIEEVIDSSAKSILIPRPRRFGKTLNMSMLHAFLDIKKSEENASLFEHLKIRETKSWELQGKYPVIYLSFKDIKELTYVESIKKVTSILQDFLDDYKAIISRDVLDERDFNYLNKLFKGEEVDPSRLSNFLILFSRVLHKVYDQNVVILIDEYDSCIIKSWQEGYYNEMITFMRNFLSAGFKDNDYLYKGVITGILRVAKESIFSGLNNLRVYSVLNQTFSDKFGLQEEEVKTLLLSISEEEQFDKVKEWYNGYQFGKSQVYNPWSIINFADSIEEGVQPYWVNTSANELIEVLLTNANADLEKKLTGLIDGQVMESEISETTIFKDLERGAEKTVLGLLLFNGYLTIDYAKQEDINYYYGLKIPNKEVAIVYKQMLERLLNKANNVNSSEILTALLDQE
ncbi:AAA family ATPase, partial [Flammeovirga aprica]